MSPSSAAFASVKLPAALVAQAREAAQPMRRSVAGQVEYWATLGRIVEHSGLTAHRARPASTEALSQADALLSQFMAAESDGSLAQRVREVSTKNSNKENGS